MLWENDKVLPITLPQTELLRRCTEATIVIDNQKNGNRNQPITHDRLPNVATCPVAAIIQRICHTLDQIPKEDPNRLDYHLGAHLGRGQPTLRCPQPNDINKAIKNAVTALNLDQKGLLPELVSSHSLQANRAMAMHLNGVSDTKIQKLGRWSDRLWLDYIHSQIACFLKGVSTSMSIHHNFRNVAL